MRIIPYESRYRDDMIFMVLEAKNALGRIPRLNDDLLDIPKYYLEKGDMFWLAVDDTDRVIGCVGYHAMEGAREAWVHRLYVKCTQKRSGIGTALLNTVEHYAKKSGFSALLVHLGGKEYFESHHFYPKRGYQEYAPSYMRKEI